MYVFILWNFSIKYIILQCCRYWRLSAHQVKFYFKKLPFSKLQNVTKCKIPNSAWYGIVRKSFLAFNAEESPSCWLFSVQRKSCPNAGLSVKLEDSVHHSSDGQVKFLSNYLRKLKFLEHCKTQTFLGIERILLG